MRKVSRKTKTLIACCCVGPVAETLSRAPVRRATRPRTSSNHATIAVATICIGPSRAVCRRLLIRFVPAVRRPFPDIARRVVQTPRVRFKTTNGDGFLAVPLAAATVAMYLSTPFPYIASPPERSRRASSRRIFPFGL